MSTPNDSDRVATSTEEAFMDCARYAEGDDLQFIKEAIATAKTLLDYQDDLGRTPAHLAAANGNLEALRILVDAGAAPLQNLEGNTALHYAAVNNHVACAKVLLTTKRWAVGTRNALGKTALQEIGEKQFDDMDSLLMEFDDELDSYTCPPTAVMNVPDEQPLDVEDPTPLPAVVLPEKAPALEVSSDTYKSQVIGSSAVDEIE
jgi:ankyrin repeat protein